MNTEKNDNFKKARNIVLLCQNSYRIIFIENNDEIVYTRYFDAVNDERAIVIAENMYIGLELDLWHGTRYVKNIPAKSYLNTQNIHASLSKQFKSNS